MKLSDDVVWHQVDNEVVALSLGGSRYFRINDSGSILWELLSGGGVGDREQLVIALTETFEVDRSVAECDVDAFLDCLRDLDALIE